MEKRNFIFRFVLQMVTAAVKNAIQLHKAGCVAPPTAAPPRARPFIFEFTKTLENHPLRVRSAAALVGISSDIRVCVGGGNCSAPEQTGTDRSWHPRRFGRLDCNVGCVDY